MLLIRGGPVLVPSSKYSIVVCNCDIYLLDSGNIPSHALLSLRPPCSCKIYWRTIWFITFPLVVNARSGSRENIFLFSYAWEKDLPKSSLHVPILANRCYMAQCHSMIHYGAPCRYACVFIDFRIPLRALHKRPIYTSQVQASSCVILLQYELGRGRNSRRAERMGTRRKH